MCDNKLDAGRIFVRSFVGSCWIMGICTFRSFSRTVGQVVVNCWPALTRLVSSYPVHKALPRLRQNNTKLDHQTIQIEPERNDVSLCSTSGPNLSLNPPPPSSTVQTRTKPFQWRTQTGGWMGSSLSHKLPARLAHIWPWKDF